MLEKFRKAKEAEVRSLIRLQEQGVTYTPWAGARPGFGAAGLDGKESVELLDKQGVRLKASISYNFV